MNVKKVNSKTKQKGYKEEFQWNNWVREVRQECGLTQVELAERCGCSRDIICKIEQGKRKLDMDVYVILCEINSHMTFPNEMSHKRREQELNTEITKLNKKIAVLEETIKKKDMDYQKLIKEKQKYYEKNLEYREKIKKLEGRS